MSKKLFSFTAVVVLTLLYSDLRAGSVFMKNGYIIQGPIVERSADTIIMGWPNGKLTIHRRFVDNVTYEVSEEKRLQEDETFKAQAKSPIEDDLSLLAVSNQSEDLPPTLDILMKKYEDMAKKGTGGDGSKVEGGVAGEGSPSGSLQGSTQLIERPDELLGDRIEDRNISISLKAPRGWSQKSKQDFFEVAAKSAGDVFRASMNVVSLPRGTLKPEDYISLLKEEDARTLDDFELLKEGVRLVGKEKGYELVGRGSYQGKEAIVRQVVVAKADRLWLISSFTEDQSSDSAFTIIEESLKTFEFTANTEHR